jgi:ribonuclease-3
VEKDLKSLEERIGFTFQNRSLLKIALTHRSYKMYYKKEEIEDNERLEFLGDAVLNLCISKLLFNKYPEDKEGDLSRKRAYLVKKETLIKVAKKLNLLEYLFLGKREEKLDSKSKENISARAVEALIGAIFLEGGWEIVYEKVKKWFQPYLRGLSLERCKDFKSKLQELIQKEYGKRPEYEIIKIYGPSHHPKFKVAVKLENWILAIAQGDTKKSAENLAAKKALKYLASLKEKKNF